MSFVDFLIKYYEWVLVVLIILIITIIGFLADKRMKYRKKKKEEKPPEIPKYNVFIVTKENKIELKIDFSFELKNTKFTEIC